MSDRVLVPVDGSPLAERAIAYGADIARRRSGTLRLLRVHVPVVPLAPPSDLGAPYYDPAWETQAREAEQRYLDATVARVREDAGVPVDGLLLDGAEIARVIVRAAAQWDATLIAMTTHGHGGAALAWLGSVASGVVRNAHRPVLVVPEGAAPTPAIARVLIAHDGTPTADTVVEPAVSLAQTYSATVTLVRVVAPPLVGDVWTVLSSEGLDRFGVDRTAELAKEALDQLAHRIRSRGVSTDAVVVVHANPARAIIDEIARSNADVVALSTTGRGLSRLLLGSVADKVIRGGNRPTLVQRPPQAAASE